MGTKICSCCKKELPKTEDYFFLTKRKQQNKSGIAVYYVFKAVCKKCHCKKSEENRLKKRCKEMNCEVSDYRKNWKKQYSETRTHFKEIIHLPKGVQSVIRNKIKEGYVFKNYEQYRVDCKKNISKVKRKYDYGDLDFVPKGTQTGIKHLTDGYIALTLKSKVKEIPKEIIETKRLIIQLKRELKTIKK
jgi:hypothetical protein